MKLDPGLVSVTAMVAVQGATLVKDFLPDISEVHKADPGEHRQFVGAMRSGELAAAIAAVAIGATVTAVTDSYVPLVVGVLSVAALLAVYEYTLRSPERFTPSP